MKFEKHIKKTALGLAVLGLAVATSAFTNKTNEAGYLTNNGMNYDFRASVPGTCEGASPDVCRYEILDPTKVDADDAPFSQAEIQDFLDKDWIDAISGAGVYNP